jgi:hypothetical protein
MSFDLRQDIFQNSDVAGSDDEPNSLDDGETQNCLSYYLDNLESSVLCIVEQFNSPYYYI